MTEIVGLLGPDQNPETELCANAPYKAQVAIGDQAECLTVEWVVTEMPVGVSEDDIYFSNKYATTTYIEVPIEGKYSFAVNCCRAA